MAQNAEQEGWGVEHQNLDKKLNAEWDMERIAGMAETAKMAEMWKRMVKMRKIAEGTRKTAVVNKKTKGESLYQNRHNTHQMDGRSILYNLKQKKLNQEPEQRLVY
jgi:hypothetical protein